MVRMHNLEILSDIALFKLYEHAQNSKQTLTAEKIAGLFSCPVPVLFLEKSLERLGTENLIYCSYNVYDPTTYEIEGKGIEYIQSQLIGETSNIFQYTEYGDEWLVEDEASTPAPMSEPLPKFTDFRDRLITALYHKVNEAGFELYYLKELADENKLIYRDGWIREVERFLDDHGYALVRKVMGGEESCAAQLNADGLEFAEELIAEPRGTVQSDDVDVWEPLPIDRSTPEYDRAVTETEQALETIENDNGYAANEPEERDHVVWSVRAGLDAVKNGFPTLEQIQSFLLSRLKMLAAKFESTAMGIAAKSAVDALKDWLSSIL